MSYVVLAFGLLLAVCGAASISFGYGIIDVERGWASVIAGAVAVSGGVVTIALALILHSLAGLRALIKAERGRLGSAPPQADAMDIGAFEPDAAPEPAAALPSSREARAAAPEAEAVAAPSLQSAQAGRQAAPTTPVAEASIEDVRRVVAQTIRRATAQRRAETPSPAPELAPEVAVVEAPPAAGAPSRRRPGSAPFGLPRALDLKDIAPQHFAGARSDVAGAPEQIEAAPPRPVGKPQPTRRGDDRFNVIGSYESEGTAYVMYADGSIDARSDLGAFHFSSMAELKAFMELQRRGEP